MARITLDEILDGISNCLIKRGYAKTKEEIIYKLDDKAGLGGFLGAREGSINIKDKKIGLKIEKAVPINNFNIPLNRFNVSLEDSNLTENGNILNLLVYKDKALQIQERGESENMKKLFKIIPSAKIYMGMNFVWGVYEGFSNSALAFVLFKNLEAKNLAALASVTSYMMLDPGEYFGEKFGCKKVEKYLSKHSPVESVLESFAKWTEFTSSKQWNARKKLENYLFEKYCNKNNDKMNEMYLSKVEEINKITENPNLKGLRDDLINSLIFERKTDIKDKKIYDAIKLGSDESAFVLDEESKKVFESAILETVKDANEFETKYKPRITKFYEEIGKVNAHDIRIDKITGLIFRDKQPKDQNLSSLISELESIDTESIEGFLRKFNREISEKKLRKERGRFSEFIDDFTDVVKKGYMADIRESEEIQEMEELIGDIKAKKELSKQDALRLNQFIADYKSIFDRYFAWKNILAEQNLLNDEQKTILNNKMSEFSQFIETYSKDRNSDFSPFITEMENYLSLKKKFVKELKTTSEREHMKLSDLEILLNKKVSDLTRRINENELEDLTENSFKFLNSNRIKELISLASFVGMTVASKYSHFASKAGWGAIIGAKSFVDGLIMGETNRITESYFLYSYRKQLEDVNVDADMAFTEYMSKCLRTYKIGSMVGLAVGLPFTYASNNERGWLMIFPVTLTLLSGAALGVSHYIFQKTSRNQVKTKAKQEKEAKAK